MYLIDATTTDVFQITTKRSYCITFVRNEQNSTKLITCVTTRISVEHKKKLIKLLLLAGDATTPYYISASFIVIFTTSHIFFCARKYSKHMRHIYRNVCVKSCLTKNGQKYFILILYFFIIAPTEKPYYLIFSKSVNFNEYKIGVFDEIRSILTTLFEFH